LSHISLTTSFVDDPDTSKGVPIELQLVGRTLEEAMIVAAAIKKLQGSEGHCPTSRLRCESTG
jgi:hypothetical protein